MPTVTILVMSMVNISFVCRRGVNNSFLGKGNNSRQSSYHGKRRVPRFLLRKAGTRRVPFLADWPPQSV